MLTACVSCIGEAACLLRRRGTIWATRSDCAFPQNSVERPRSTASCFYFLYGQERGHRVPIVRNVAWNDLVTQIKYLPDDSPQESLFKEVLVIQKFLSEHATEVSVTDYDIAVFRAIDQVRARLQKADKDLETIKKELSYKEQVAKIGR